MNDPDDNETKIALLASLLEPSTYPISDYLEALTAADGDVGRAAEEMLIPRIRSAGKRKMGSSLESWLGRKRSAASRVKEVVTTTTRTTPTTTTTDEERKPSFQSQDGNTSTINVETHSSSISSTPDLMSLLRRPTTPPKTKSKSKNSPQPALVLTSQAAIDAHSLPVTLLQSPLPASLASALYLTMMQESEDWEANKWFLAGKWVESPHLMSSYARSGSGHGDEHGKAKYYYTGSDLGQFKDYPALLKLAADMIEPVVNAALEKRARYPYEWAGKWRASVCGTNRYDGASSSVGWHADQLTYLGPYTTIASLSLGTPRAFRLRQTESVDPAYANNTKPIRTYEINLGHNSLVLMDAGCQERYKHTVPSQKALDLFRPAYDIDQQPIPLDAQKAYTSRINLTFRFYREDFHPLPSIGPFGPRQGTPICKCGIPTLLRADQKAKARSRHAPSPSKRRQLGSPVADDNDGTDPGMVNDDMAFFWQCQSPAQTGDVKGCGFFKILDMKAEGRGPCVVDVRDGRS